MSEPVIVDSACLIGLERVRRLDLLPSLYDPVLAPPAVAREFGAPPAWLHIEAPSNQATVLALKTALDDGEAEAIALALERGHLLILDDLKARAFAQRLGLKLIGLVRLLLRAKEQGLIPAIRPLLDELEAQQFHLSKAIREKALRLAGE